MPAAERTPGALLLQDWQREMQACIVVPQRDRSTLRAWLHAGSVDIDSQINVYADAYVLRLSEALRCNYPALHQALGDADFETMAQAYIDRHPSAHASIRWYGAALASFLREAQPWCAVPVLSELAEFEWAIRHTIDAADAKRWTVGVSGEGHLIQSVEVRPRPRDSSLVAWEAPWRESKTVKPSDHVLVLEYSNVSGRNVQ